MPKYTFTCSACNFSSQFYVSSKVKEKECLECWNMMKRQVPKLSGNSNVTETVNKYTNTSHRRDHSKIMKERQDEYYWTVEVPRMVASGTYSLETMLENGWVYFNDKKEMVVNDKPPHRR